MKFTSIPQSQVAAYGRMDAAFHIAVKEVADSGMLEKVKSSFSEEEAIEALGLLSSSQLQEVTKDLVTGSYTNSKSVQMAITKYPHIALSIAMTRFDPIAELMKQKIEVEEKIEKLEAVKRKLT